jgi:hypothetical protein
MLLCACNTSSPPPPIDCTQALSKANRGKTLDDVAASADKAMTFTAILKKTSPQGSYGVVRFFCTPPPRFFFFFSYGGVGDPRTPPFHARGVTAKTHPECPASLASQAIGSTSDDKHIMYEIKNKDAAMKSGAMALLVNDVITKVGTETLKDASQYTHAEFVQIMKDSHVLLLEIQRPHKDYVAVSAPPPLPACFFWGGVRVEGVGAL